MMFDQWAYEWGIPIQAVQDYKRRIGILMEENTPKIDGDEGDAGSETRQQALIRIDAARNGIWLTRNNVGAMLDERGIPVRYGLANESKLQNTVMKSGDLIGMRTILIGPQHVGRNFAQFVSREAKKEDWTYRGTEREIGQLNWCNFVNSKGGDAAFSTGPGSFADMRHLK